MPFAPRGSSLKVATWNVNSLRVRLPHVLKWLEREQPDVLALQETKMRDDEFPADAFSQYGYLATFSGQSAYNGVAMLSRAPLTDVAYDIGGGYADEQRRVLGATIGGVRLWSLYVPNGQSVDSDKYRYKLEWLAALRALLADELARHPSLLFVGDFNIAPDDRDVYDPAKFVGSTHVTPPERAALRELLDWGLVDVFRRHHDEDRLFSWWDYRAGDFHEHRGLRIDLVLASPVLADRAVWSLIDRNARKGKPTPSDHAPLVVEFD
jgi:exodeoxyribonuclease III